MKPWLSLAALALPVLLLLLLIALITVLSLAPSILVMMTSFTRIVVVLSFLRTAMGCSRRRPTR
jgi:flagellar biosynthesis protein FliP